MGEATPVVRLLGGVRICVDGSCHEVGGPHPKAFLAALAREAGKVVANERIGDLVWGPDHLPRDERAALHQTATRVRRVLRGAGLGDLLNARSPGYVLEVPPSSVDALAFRSLVRVGRDAVRDGDHVLALERLGEALGLWDGNALTGLDALPIHALGKLLDDERWSAEELRCRTLVDLGRDDEAIDLLTAATTTEPLRESLWVMLVRASVRTGRHAEAAAIASSAVATLTAGFGARPGSELTELATRLRTEVPPTFTTLGHHRLPTSDARRPLLDSALERAVDAARQSARDALARGAHHEAVRHWERALELCQVAAPDDRDRHLTLLLELGAAHNQASLDEEARRTFRRAALLARELRSPTALALAALGYCADRISFRPPPEAAALLEEAIDGLGPRDDPALRSKLLSRLAIEVYWSGPLDRCRVLASDALALAETSEDHEAVLEAWNATGYGSWTPARTPELVTLATTYLETANALGDRAHRHLAHRWLAVAMSELGDVAGGRTNMGASLELADELGHPPFQWMARCVAAGHAVCAGDLVTAEQLASDALAIGSTVEPDVALDNVSLLIWTCRWLQGRLAEIAELVEAVAGTPGLDLPRRLGLAMTYASLGRGDDARSLLDAVTIGDLETMPRDASWFSGMAALAETIGMVPHSHAAWVVDQLTPFRDRIGFSPSTVTGPVAHQLGVCLWAAGRRDEALDALADAVDLAERAGMPIFEARGRLALAERHLLAGDRVRARCHAEAVLDRAEALGLRGVTAAARHILDQPR